jgi:hypothetical protein
MLQRPAKQSTVRAAAWLAVTFAIGIAIGVVIDRLALSPSRLLIVPGGVPEGAGNSTVTREIFVKIKPEMSEWEVIDLLGPGQLISEEGQVVDSTGQYKKWRRGGGINTEETGTLMPHDGRSSKRVRQDTCWQAGSKAIYVTFVNGRVAAKSEKGLY